MATPTNSLAPLLATAAARIGTARGRAMILAEGVVADVGEVTTGDKGQRKRMVTIALLGGTREPQVLRGKLVDDTVVLADGLEAYTRVRVLATTATYTIEGKVYDVIIFHEIERVTQGPARAEAAA